MYLFVRTTLKKPGSKLFEKAVIKHEIDLGKSLFLGDSQSDSEAAKRLDLKFIRYERSSFNETISEIYSALQKRESLK
jgi:histidinol phosphatase-like enzyme